MALVLLVRSTVGSTTYTSSWNTVTHTMEHDSYPSNNQENYYKPAGLEIDKYCSGTSQVVITTGPTVQFIARKWRTVVSTKVFPNSVACGFVPPDGYEEGEEFNEVPSNYLRNSGLTMSYQTDLQSWTGEHEYYPNWILSNGTRMYMTREASNAIHKHNIGDYGKYLGLNKQELEIELVINKAPIETKSFDNFIFHTETSDEYDTFKTVQVFNNKQNSGELSVFIPKSFEELTYDHNIRTLIVEKVSNEFRSVIPPDLVNDSKGDIFTESNLVSAGHFSEEDRQFRPRMKGKFIVARLKYDNKDYFRFYTIKTNFRLVAR